MSAISIEFKSKTYVAKDFEFIYMDHYPVKRGQFYKIIYTKDKKEIYLGLNGQRLVPQKRFVKPSLFTQYKRAKGSIQRENYLKSFSYQLTDKQKEKNSFPRYFAQYVFDKKGNIFEIRKLDYQKITPLYKKVSMSWFIKGDKERVKEQNELQLKRANGQLSGMWDYLDPLEFYEEEVKLTPKEITMKKLERLLHNPHSYGSHSEASNIGNALGLSGAHQMPDGTWMPGSTHAEYLKAMNNRTIQTPAGNIPTQNLRRNSGY